MMFILFIDDERHITDAYVDHTRYQSATDVVIARSSREAIQVIDEQFPNHERIHIDFDHDLGGDDTAMRVVHHLGRNPEILTGKDFSYAVHSMNPVGKANIKGTMESLLRFIHAR